MDLIEYANKFTELEYLIRAVYGGTEGGIYVDESEDLTSYTIRAYIPNWIGWRTGMYKSSKNSKGYVPRAVGAPGIIGNKYLLFGFWEPDADEYLVYGFER